LKIGVIIASESDLIDGVSRDDDYFSNSNNDTVTFPSLEDYTTTPVNNQQIYALFKYASSHSSSTQSNMGVSGGVVAVSFLANVARLVDERGSPPTVYEVLDLYSQVFDPDFSDAAVSSIFQEDKYKSNYLSSIKFMLRKNLDFHTAYLNGIPLPLDAQFPSRLVSVLAEEQYRITVMVSRGIISDRTKSLYAKLLTGENVHSRYHELLSEREGEMKYVEERASETSERNLIPLWYNF